jgi:hypothetical protein
LPHSSADSRRLAWSLLNKALSVIFYKSLPMFFFKSTSNAVGEFLSYKQQKKQKKKKKKRKMTLLLTKACHHEQHAMSDVRYDRTGVKTSGQGQVRCWRPMSCNHKTRK